VRRRVVALLASLLLVPSLALAASGNLLLLWGPQASVPPASNYGTLDIRGTHLVADFDDTTSECLYFRGVMPANYAGGGIAVKVHASLTSATTGTLGWLVALERVSDSQQDIDSTGFASDNTITATTVPGTSGHVSILSVNISSGANMDSIAAGEGFRLRLCRDVASDSATGDGELWLLAAYEQ